MIDFSTDEGMREAFRTVATWSPSTPTSLRTAPRPSSGSSSPSLLPVDLTAPEPHDLDESHVRSRRSFALVAAVAVLVAALTASVLLRGETPADVAAAQGQWEAMADAPLSARFEPAYVWTGEELIVWGGYNVAGETLVDGAAYNPTEDRWREIADFPFDHWRQSGPPFVDGSHSAAGVRSAWMNGEALFLTASPESDWAWDISAYDPTTNEWRVVLEARLPVDPLKPRSSIPIYTIEALLPWGDTLVAVGWSFDALGWTTLDTSTGEWGEFTPFFGSEDSLDYSLALGAPYIDADRLVWLRHGGMNSDPLGFIADLESGAVIQIEYPNYANFSNVYLDASVTTEGVVVGRVGNNEGRFDRVAYRLDPTTGTWTDVRALPRGPTEQDNHRAIAFPGGTFVFGGLDMEGRYGGLKSQGIAMVADSAVERWQDVPTPPISIDRIGHVMVWTGDEVIIWGGATNGGEGSVNVGHVALSDGARYRP